MVLMAFTAEVHCHIPKAPRKIDGPSMPSLDFDWVKAVDGDTLKSDNCVGKRITGAKYENRIKINAVRESSGAR